MVTAFFSNWHNWVVNYQHSQPVNQVNGNNQRTIEASRTDVATPRRGDLRAFRACLPTAQHGGLTVIPSPPISARLVA